MLPLFSSAVFVEGRIAGVEVFLIHVILRYAERITEAGNLSFVYCLGCE
jgi:hypothetical protein